MELPQIIFLNGVSSAGKSSLAKELQERLPTPYLHLCIDSFEEMMPRRPEFDSSPIFAKLLSGLHHSMAAMADCGNNLIIDHVLVEGEPPLSWVPECLALLTRFDLMSVGVRCPLQELERRERARGDRPAGLSAWQFSRMHLRMCYDIEVNTASVSPAQASEAVLAALKLPRTAWKASLEAYGLSSPVAD